MISIHLSCLTKIKKNKIISIPKNIMPPRKTKKRSPDDITLPFHSEIKCSQNSCSNQASFITSTTNRIVCGVHSRSVTRTQLRINPNAKRRKKDIIDKRKALVSLAAARNKEAGVRGHVILSKLRMKKPVEHKDGYLKVFPNFKHQNWKNGFGCKSLSPMSLGPVVHDQPGLPDAINIENYHQFNKVFPSEVDDNGEPLPIFYDRQRKAYRDPIPHRHKFPYAEMKKLGKNGNKNVPLYSLHDGKKYNYVESRQFYCKQYEMLAQKQEDFKRLQKAISNGTNLMICGYDAYPIEGDPTREKMKAYYMDGSRPFGHELVLFCLLVLEKEDYPWKQ